MNRNIFVLLCLVGSASVFAQSDRYEWPRQARQENQQSAGTTAGAAKPNPYLPKVIQTITSSDNSFSAERSDQNALEAQDKYTIGLQISEISKAKGAFLEDLVAGHFSITVVLHAYDATTSSYVEVAGKKLTVHVYNHQEAMSYQVVGGSDIAAELSYKGALDSGCTGSLDEKIKCLLNVD